MANRYHGSYRLEGPRQKRSNGSMLPRGIARDERHGKRDDAFERNAQTAPTRRRQYRLEQEAAQWHTSVSARSRIQRRLSREARKV